MKKKVGVITMYRQNYGAFLQAYALQKQLENCGYEAEIIRYDYYKDKTLLEIPLAHLKTPFRFFKMVSVAILRLKSNKKRRAIFEQSIERNLKESEEYYKTYSKLRKKPPKYDIYLTGSDQVFNPNLSPQATKSRLLCFSKGVKVSYAASSGRLDFSDRYRELLGKELAGFKKISVREHELKIFLKSEYGIDVEEHIDPTMLLTKEEWLKFSDVKFPKGGYVLFYRISKQQELIDLAEQISKKLCLPVLVADGKEKFANQIERTDFLSPEEWVGAIANAAYVVTNSFHGTAFSINLHKKACIVLPEHGKARIENIIKNCNLERFYNPEIISDEEQNELFIVADKYFENERLRSENFLKGIEE